MGGGGVRWGVEMGVGGRVGVQLGVGEAGCLLWFVCVPQ